MVTWTLQPQSNLPKFDPLPKDIGTPGGAVVMNDKVYVCGGAKFDTQIRQWNYYEFCWTASIRGGGWTQIESMKQPRGGPYLFKFGNRLMAGSGWNKGGTTTVEWYTEKSGWSLAKWTLPGTAPSSLSQGACVIAFPADGEIKMVTDSWGANFYKIDVETGKSVKLPHPLNKNTTLYTWNSCAQDTNTLYIGEYKDKSEKTTMWKYSISEDSWDQLADLPLKHMSRMVVVDGELVAFRDDRVYVLREGAWLLLKEKVNLPRSFGTLVVLPSTTT